MLDEWAKKWGVSSLALIALRSHLIGHETSIFHSDAGEAGVQQHIRVTASESGWRLWRNNLGAGKLENGSFIRWGLCNDSPQVNSRIKSADLIGIRPVIITRGHIGTTIGQFVSRECKAPGWMYSSTNEREHAQMRWAEIVNALGGDAKFTTGEL